MVLTSVDRDDLDDGGANHFATTVELIKSCKPDMLVECLVSDFRGDQSAVDVSQLTVNCLTNRHKRSSFGTIPLIMCYVMLPMVWAEQRLATSGLDVYAHNIETVRRLQPYVRDKRASYEQSLSVLERAKGSGVYTKSSIMLGLGETEDEILEVK